VSEVKALQEELVDEDELQAAKRYIVGSFHIQNETPEAIASRMLSLYFFGLPNDYYSTYARQIEAVSAEDILRVAKTYLHPEALVISVAGNKDSLQEPLSRLGEVRCLDAEGHLIKKT
jgi:predicted Zn-dependent peptidase